jgi:general secretion pathway protein I
LSRSNRAECGAAGFTLIEVLVALAIVGLVLAALSTLIGTTRRGALSIAEHVQRLVMARAIVTALPSRDRLIPGEYRGEKFGGHWRIDVGPFEAAGFPSDARSTWIPEVVTVTIQPPAGAAMQISTISLRHRDQR